jgi:dihydroorotate dehydrogenase (NAD+) catalytic subunit
VCDWGSGLINAVGLSNPGVEEFILQFSDHGKDFPLIVSIFGRTLEDFSVLAREIDQLEFSFLEVNISCPNVEDEFGKPFCFSQEMTSKITRQAKDGTGKPVIVKLSPNTDNLVRIAKSAEAAGADALCIMNTLGPGMIIDTKTGVPILSNGSGGISGAAVLPITVNKVYEVYREVSIPIIGMGGIADSEGALQVLMAGATLYGIGSAVYSEGLSVFRCIEQDILEFLRINHIESSEEIIGLAHKKRKISYMHGPGLRKKKEPKKTKPNFCVTQVTEIMKSDRGTVKTLFFNGEELRAPEPGQFFMLWVPGSDQKPYSVSFFQKNLIGFSLIERGPFSKFLFKLTPGDPVGILGPLGRGFCFHKHQRYLLIGGGIGCSPLVFAVHKLATGGKEVHVLAGGKTEDSISWVLPLLEKFGVSPKVHAIFCTEDGSFGEKGMITHHLAETIETIRPDHVLICGPELLIKHVMPVVKMCGISGQACIERMMKCGIGICGSCTMDDTGDRVCVEGPVFDLDYLGRVREFGHYKRDESGAVCSFPGREAVEG